MPFPESDRIPFPKNQIDNVVCQLRFSPIYSIDFEPPAEFQKLIASEFPEALDIVYEGTININLEQNQSIPISPNANYCFKTSDDKWRVNLTRTFLSLTCDKAYPDWEIFYHKFCLILDAFSQCYPSIKIFTRVGLQYTNVFVRSKLGLEDSDWSELIVDAFSGPLSTKFASSVANIGNTCEINLIDGKSKAVILSTLVTDPVDQNQTSCFYLSSDFFTTNKTTSEDLKSVLDFLHIRATRFIRFAIKEKLKEAMR